MQFSAVFAAAVLATAASASSNGTVAFTTEVHTAYTTVCPEATTLTFNSQTYTATASETITITNCPCTIVKPVTTSSVVAVPTSAPVYANSTTAAATTAPVIQTSVVGTTSSKSSPTATPSTISASGADKAMAFSGFSLAGVLALAAYIL